MHQGEAHALDLPFDLLNDASHLGDRHRRIRLVFEPHDGLARMPIADYSEEYANSPRAGVADVPDDVVDRERRVSKSDQSLGHRGHGVEGRVTTPLLPPRFSSRRMASSVAQRSAPLIMS